MRRAARLTGAAGLAAALALTAGGCATPEYEYVRSSRGDVVFRVPRSWSAIDTQAALKAMGTDPGSVEGWAAVYDGSATPSLTHVSTPNADAPLMYAQSKSIPPEQRSSVTDEELLELMLPGTPESRELRTKTKEYALISTRNVARRDQRGVHVRWSLKIGRKTEVFDRIALTDPKRTRMHLLFVHCTEECFREHPEIDGVVTSLTVKSL